MRARLVSSVADAARVRWADVTEAIRLAPVRLGLLGTILLALGSLTPAYLPQASPFWPTMRALGLDTWWAMAFGTALVIVAVGCLIVAWLRLRPAIYVDVKHWAVLAWWSLPLLVAPPIFSHDAYSYAAHGWLMHNGLNPYETSPAVLPGGFADQVAWVWRFTPTPYGPLSLEISHWLVDLAGLNPYYSAVLMRLPALVGVALIVHYLPRIGRQMGVPPRDVAWFATINPLLVIDFVGGAHNDALMVGLVVLALHLAYRGWFWPALLAAGVAMSVKQPALLAAYPLAIIGSGWASWHWRDVVAFLPRLIASFAVVIGVFVAVSLATGLGFGWMNAAGVPGMIVTLAPFSLLGWLLQQGADALGLDSTGRAFIGGSQAVGTVLALLCLAWLAVTRARTEPVRFLAWGYLAVAIFGPAMHPWYLLWGGVLLPLTRPSRRLWRLAAVVTAIVLVYGAANLAWRNDAVALALAAVAAAGLWLTVRHQNRRRT
ncbi:polyprenol phosphomannose-dependent alpha 1,6 mannosyltransferase MptB [Propioniciclava soli]|uniref:polyprenol phosphomannose-dependent alpha 1,6 mannosyltransferase MptB n=1 Tax=Propioniciclava soli TaxID=2775081 RepID=UPI001E410BF9